TAKEPIVDLRALTIRNFGIGSILSFITGIGIFCTVFLTPVFLGRVRGFDSTQIGVALLSVGIAQLFGLAVYSRLARVIDQRYLLLFGLTLFGLGCWLYVPLTHDWGWQQLVLPQALRGFGQQFSIAPIVTMSLGSLPPARLRSASGLFNLMRNLGGAIGIAVVSTMLNDRLNLHFLRLNEHVTYGRPTVEALLNQNAAHFAQVGGNVLDGANASLSLLHQLAMREALVLTFSDTFAVVAACFAFAVVLALFSKSLKPGAAPPPDAH
ncbi:MAG TPA: MFS transporter, partial [Pararobbsia sp.]|nr:MFS transporter [Pararobbsia sp.]